jgi:hypothetical protein
MGRSGAPRRPYPAPVGVETGQPTAALVTRFDSFDHAQTVIGWANQQLRDSNSDLKRHYSLSADLGRNGQEVAGVAVLHAVTWPDEAGHESTRFGLANVLGNSRAMYRLDHLGVRWEEAAFGLRLSTLRAARAGEEHAEEQTAEGRDRVLSDQADSWNRLMAVYETLYESGQPPKGYEAVLERVDLEAAARLAEAECFVIVGVSDPERSLELVQRRNLRDHLRGNQELDPAARALALGADVVDRCVAAGIVPHAHGAALVGAVPPDVLLPDGSGFDAEGARRGYLGELLFSSDDRYHAPVAAALGEPARKSDLRRSHIDLRSRVLAALVSRGRVNPRVGQVITLTDAKTDSALSGQSVSSLLRAAQSDPFSSAADELLGFHALLLLAEERLYEAVRGSSDAPRQPMNVKAALLRDRRRAVGLLAEIVDARAENRTPCQVDETGEVIRDLTANLAWFNETFPADWAAPAGSTGRRSTHQQLEDVKHRARETVDELGRQVARLRDHVDAIVGLCEGHGLPLDAEWVKNVNFDCSTTRDLLMKVNRADVLAGLARRSEAEGED